MEKQDNKLLKECREEINGLRERLKSLREHKGLTQEHLGEVFSIGNKEISKYESGKACPRLVTLLAYSRYFQVSLDSLFPRNNDGSSQPLLNELTSQLKGTKGDTVEFILDLLNLMNEKYLSPKRKR